MVIARVLSGLVVAIGGVALLARATEPGIMPPEVAAGFCLAGLGVALLSGPGWVRPLGLGVVGLVALLGCLELSQQLTGIDLGFAPSSWREGGRAPVSPVSPISALEFLLLGVGLLLGRGSGARASAVGQALIVVGLLLAVHILFGYAYGLESFSRPFANAPMQLLAAIAFGLFAFACLYSCPPGRIGAVFTDPGPSGALVRRMLPAMLLTPLVLVWAAGAGQQARYFGPGFARALVSTGNAVLMVLFLAWLVLRLRKSDRELQTAVERLSASERMFRLSFENAFVGMAHLDPSRVWTRVNPRLAELLGYEPGAILAKPLSAHVHPEDLPPLEDRLRALQDGTIDLFTGQQRWIASDGESRWFDVYATARRSTAGEFRHFILVVQDVTAVKQATEKAEALLRTTVEERGRALEAARARDVLLAIVSHELRSPLNSIRLWASILQGDPSPDAATLQKAVRQIEAGVVAQSRLISDLLDVSSFVSGKLELERDQVQVPALVLEVAAERRAAAEDKGVKLEIRAPDVAPLVDGDRARLRQVVGNLVENAIKFTPKGGNIRVEVDARPTEIELRVQDDGEGISAEHLPRIFDQFWQADGGSGRPHGGLGLGLSIVKLMVERHGGSIVAHSDGPGRGSKFTVRLPVLASDASTAVEALPAGRAPPIPEGDVLVVDDERDTAEALALALRVRGLRVHVAFDAESALASIAGLRPRVLVSDLMMPGMSGFDLLRRIREEEHDGRLARIHAIAISGRGSPSDRRRVRGAGFDAYLPKPISVQTVFGWISEAMVRAPAVEPARLNVMMVGGEEELLMHLRWDGHEAWRVRDLAEASTAGSRLRPRSVLLVDLDEVPGDIEDLVRRLRENSLSLFVVGLTLQPGRTHNSEIFDSVLEKPLRPEKLRRTLKLAMDS